jgi:curved DNA-binding protein CbpA
LIPFRVFRGLNIPLLRTHYDTLHVSRDASPAEIQSAYRRLARRYHPDRTGHSPENEAAMQALNAAYEVLSDPQKRAEHDRWIAAELGAEPFAVSPFDFETAAPVAPPPASRPVWRSVLSAFLFMCYFASTLSLIYIPGLRIVGILMLLAGWLHYRNTHAR